MVLERREVSARMLLREKRFPLFPDAREMRPNQDRVKSLPVPTDPHTHHCEPVTSFRHPPCLALVPRPGGCVLALEPCACGDWRATPAPAARGARPGSPSRSAAYAIRSASLVSTSSEKRLIWLRLVSSFAAASKIRASSRLRLRLTASLSRRTLADSAAAPRARSQSGDCRSRHEHGGDGSAEARAWEWAP